MPSPGPAQKVGSVTVIVLGLACSTFWGVADFLAGVASRRSDGAWVAALGQAAGLVAVLMLVTLLHAEPPGPAAMLEGAAAGAAGGIGLIAFYRALAVGMMGLVAPVSALGVAVPVTVGLAGGERPSALALAGVVLGVGGVALATRNPGPADRAGVGLALVAAAGFGVLYTLLARAAADDAVWAATSARMAAVPVIVAAALVLRAPRGIDRRDRPRIALAGLLDVAAAVAFGVAAQRWPISLVAVLASLYPVVTIALARAELGERLGPRQLRGIVLVAAGVVLMSSG
jgi:drug/metabolite transporter (DMT)-like permease